MNKREHGSRYGEGLTEREYDDAADLIEQFQAQCEIAFEDHAVNAKRWVREQMESIRRAADARTSPRPERRPTWQKVPKWSCRGPQMSHDDKQGEAPSAQNFAGRLRGNAAFLAANWENLTSNEAQVLVRALEAASDYVEDWILRNKALLSAILPSRAEIIEECAKVVEPQGFRPCDCETCYCGNSGDARAVAQHDEGMTMARAIRALKNAAK